LSVKGKRHPTVTTAVLKLRDYYLSTWLEIVELASIKFKKLNTRKRKFQFYQVIDSGFVPFEKIATFATAQI
jgi:hypothetical protein